MSDITDKEHQSISSPEALSQADKQVPAPDNGILTDETELTAEMSESIKMLPPAVRRTVMSVFQGKIPGDGHPLFEKFSSNHIDKFLDIIKTDDQNQYKYYSSNRWFQFLYVIIGSLVFLGIMWILIPIDKKLFEDILQILVAFGGGLGSGIGLKSHLDKKK